MISENKKRTFIFLGIYLLLWIVLFEFILPVNNILPKPSIVIQSFPSLIDDYQLFPNYISTVAVIYIALFLAYFTVKYLSFIPRKKVFIDFIWSLEWFSEYIPGIVLGLLLLFWFPGSEYVEFLFAYLTAFFSMLIRMQNAAYQVPGEYLLASRSLGFSENKMSSKINWKFGQAGLLDKMNSIHFNLWLVLIAFEYIKGGYGIGNIFQTALAYKDISAFFSAAILTGITIFLGYSAINYIRYKINFWK